jgi:hypothetical protein
MFYDERIELEKGKVCSNCLIIATVGAFFIGASQLINTLMCIAKPQLHHYANVLLPSLIAFGGLAILIYGFIKTSVKPDERTKAEASAYWGKAGLMLLRAIMVLWAILLPYTMLNPMPTINFAAIPFDNVLTVLFDFIFIYCVYSFKKRDIYFNYSILESESYYKGVFKNLGKLAVWAAALFAESVFFYIVFYTFENLKYPPKYMRDISSPLLALFLIIFSAYAMLAVLYLALSALEKSSYDNEKKLLSRSTVAAIIVSGVMMLFMSRLATLVIDIALSAPSLLPVYNYITHSANTTFEIMLALAVTYFSYEYTRAKNTKSIGKLCGAIIISNLVYSSSAFVFSRICNIILINKYVLTQSPGIAEFQFFMGDTILLLSNAHLLLSLTLISLIIFTLVRDGVIPKMHHAAPVLFAIYFCTEIYFRTQSRYDNISYIYTEICTAIFFFYLCILAVTVGKKDIDSKF